MKDDIFDTFALNEIAILFDNAFELHEAGKFQEALEAYNKVIALKPNHNDALINIGCVLEDIGEKEQALFYLNKAIELEENFRAYYNCGFIYKRQRKYNLAIQNYTRAIELNPLDISAYNDRGFCYSQIEKYDDAINDLTRAMELNPLDLISTYNRGWCYSQIGKYDDAINDLTRAVALNPLYSTAYSQRGWCYSKIEKYDDAINDHTKAIELNPRNSNAYQNRGWCYSQIGKYDDAIKEYTRAIELSPLDVIAYKNRGWYYLQVGKYDDALEDYRNAMKLQYPEYDHRELVILTESNQYEKIVSTYEKFISAGFYPDLGDYGKYIIVKPYIKEGSIILKPENIHVGKTNKRHLDKMGNRYELFFDTDFNAIMDRLDFHYNEEDDKAYMLMLRNIFPILNQYAHYIRAVSVALYLDGCLVAGELGILAGKVYISLTGFHDADSSGSAQIILLARDLVKKGIVLWDLGPSTGRHDPYKLRLGAEKFTNKEYFDLFHSVNPGSENILKKHQD